MRAVSAFTDDWEGHAAYADETPAEPTRNETGHTPRSRRWWLVPIGAGLAAALVVGLVRVATSDASPEEVAREAERITAPEAPAEPSEVPDETAAGAVEAAATGGDDSATGGLLPASEREGAVENAPAPPPAWARFVEDANPFVPVEAAQGEVVLGLSPELADKAERWGLTGLDPSLEVLAPRYAYALQRHEVTWEEVGRFLRTHDESPLDVPGWSPRDPETRAKMPATNVPWAFAQAFCEALGGALPSEAEWAWAARGPELATFPWGDALPYADRVRFRRGDPVPLATVGSMAQDRTPGREAIHDLLGNAREWTRDRWETSSDDGPGDERRVVRGWPLGEAGAPIPHEGLTYRAGRCSAGPCAEGEDLETVGFRCMRR